jgi:phage baseplate assembly protein W
MAEGLAVELPLNINSTDGPYGLHKGLIDMAAQNLKMIVLTTPGERIMAPNFGVGIRRYLFEQNSPGTIENIRNRIIQQVKTYLPYIVIRDLKVYSPDISGSQLGDTDKTTLMISISYAVPAANATSTLTIPVEG